MMATSQVFALVLVVMSMALLAVGLPALIPPPHAPEAPPNTPNKPTTGNPKDPNYKFGFTGQQFGGGFGGSITPFGSSFGGSHGGSETNFIPPVYGGMPYGSPYGGSPYGGRPFGGRPFGGIPFGGNPYFGSPNYGGSYHPIFPGYRSG